MHKSAAFSLNEHGKLVASGAVSAGVEASK